MVYLNFHFPRKKKEEINKTNIYIYFLNRPCLEGLFGIVKGATPVVKAGRIRPGGRSLGTLELVEQPTTISLV